MDAFFGEIQPVLSGWANAGYISSSAWMLWREPMTCTAGISFDPAYLDA